MPSSIEVPHWVVNTVPDKATYDAMVAQGLVNQNELYLVGGWLINPVQRTQAMTRPVGMDEANGTFWTEPVSGSGEPAGTWTLLGSYDLSLSENQVSSFTITQYQGAPFTAKALFFRLEGVYHSSGTYTDIGTGSGSSAKMQTLSNSGSANNNHQYALLIPCGGGAFQIAISQNQYFTGGGIKENQGYKAGLYLPANSAYIGMRNGVFAGGNIEVWGLLI